MSTENLIKIATDFSEYPGVRYARLGPNSGEEFREQVLLPKLKSGAPLTIDLNDTQGLGSSFLEEAFGGAVRRGFSLSAENITFICAEADTLKEVWGYITRAMEARAQGPER